MELKGFPIEGDPYEVIKKLGRVLEVPVDLSEIDICHRVPTSKPNEKNIVVRFIHRTKRGALLSKAKRNRLNTSMLQFPGTPVPIFVNKHLTRASKQLLGAAIARKRSAGWKYVWSNEGKLVARRNDDSRQ